MTRSSPYIYCPSPIFSQQGDRSESMIRRSQTSCPGNMPIPVRDWLPVDFTAHSELLVNSFRSAISYFHRISSLNIPGFLPECGISAFSGFPSYLHRLPYRNLVGVLPALQASIAAPGSFPYLLMLAVVR